MNHFGHFLLTNLLLPTLRQTENSRIVNLSSGAHGIPFSKGGINFDNLMWEKNYNDWMAYGRSKLANVYFTKELSS